MTAKKNKYYLATFPQSFMQNADILLVSNYENLKRDKFYALFYLLETQMYKNKAKKYGFVEVYSKKLVTLLGKNYKQYITAAMEAGIIETDNRYIKGCKSKFYRYQPDFFTEVYNYVNFEEVELFTEDFKLHEVLRKQYDRPTKVNLRKIYDLLRGKRFEFNSRAAKIWLTNLAKSKYFEEVDGKFNYAKYSSYLRMIDDIANRRVYVVEDTKTGRIFHNFNLMKRELRKFCTIDGEELLPSDLKSSQPYFLANHVLKAKPECEDVRYFFEVVTKRDIYNFFLEKHLENNEGGMYKDFDRSVWYYSRKLHRVVNGAMRKKYATTRNDIKPQFLKVLFKGNKGQAMLEKHFVSYFPNVAEYIKEAKKVEKNALAIKLQKEEADVFITAYSLLSNEMPLLPVHDSLYVKKSDYKRMNEVLENTFNKKGYSGYTLSL